jgi:hypothetical protein
MHGHEPSCIRKKFRQDGTIKRHTPEGQTTTTIKTTKLRKQQQKNYY